MSASRAVRVRPRGSRLAESISRPASRGTDAQADELRLRGIDVLPLSGHPQVALPDAITEAARRAVAENAAAPSRGLPALRAALARRTQALYAAIVDPDREIVVVNGAMQGLSLVFRALLDPGDEVLIPSPCFFFDGTIRLAGGVPRYVPMDPASGFAWDVERIERAITPQTKVLLVSSPVNPTGYVVPPEDCARLANLAVEHDLMVVSDEAYERFVYDGRAHTSMLAFAEQLGDRLVVIASASKSYAMSSLRVGWVIGTAALIDTLIRLLEWEQLTCSPAGQSAAAAAIDGRQDWMDEVVRQFEDRRNVLYQGLSTVPVIRTHLPLGGPFFLLDVSRLGQTSQVVADAWLSEHGIPTSPGDAFQAPGHLRLGYGAPAALDLDDLIMRIRCAAKGTTGPALAVERGRRTING